MYIENNAPAMKTVVETFVVEEVEALIYDNEKLDQWNTHVERLGLIGQLQIQKPKKSPIPFLSMNEGLVNTFECLCPRKIDIKEFNVTPIPVEILDLVALSVNEKYFKKIEAWWDDKTPDPVIVGFTGYFMEMEFYADSNKSLKGKEFDTAEEVIEAGGKHPYLYNSAKFLIGKWGDVKHSFEQLKEMATARYIAEQTNTIKGQMKDLTRRLDDVAEDAFNRFGNVNPSDLPF